MTSKGHKKHADIKKPSGGKIHRNELAIIGAPCGIIQKLTDFIAKELKEYKVGYVDADHNSSESTHSFYRKYTDKIQFHQAEFYDENIEYSFRSIFHDCDVTLVNGNHFKASSQAVIINEKKKESLQRKLDRLTDVKFFILDGDQSALHDYLVEENSDFKDLPVYKIEDLKGICAEVRKLAESNRPKVKGLVLAGGKSMRMGVDKGTIAYHGKPQREFIADELAKCCDEVFLSVREENQFESNYDQLKDTFTDLGPFGGILSAFRSDPDAAWLVVATDIPFLKSDTLSTLIEKRDLTKVATCFHNPETEFPEPLITLWEPKAYQRLLSFLSLGYSCPRKALINSDINEIHPDNYEVLFNANTPEEKEKALNKLNA